MSAGGKSLSIATVTPSRLNSREPLSSERIQAQTAKFGRKISEE